MPDRLRSREAPEHYGDHPGPRPDSRHRPLHGARALASPLPRTSAATCSHAACCSRCLRDDSPVRLVGLTERLSAEQPELRPASAEAALEMLGVEEPAAAAAVERVAPATPGALGRAALAAGCRALRGGAARRTRGRTGSGTSRRPTSGRSGMPGTTGTSPTNPEQEPGAPGLGQQAPPGTPAADGVALNDGYALIQQGAYDDAIPVLEQAVAALEGTGDLSVRLRAVQPRKRLRLAGRPADAIPILQQRLEIPNQTKSVAAELKQAEKDLKEQEKAAKKGAAKKGG